MGGICSRKRDEHEHVVEDELHRGVSGRYCRINQAYHETIRIEIRQNSHSDQLTNKRTQNTLMKFCETFIYYSGYEVRLQLTGDRTTNFRTIKMISSSIEILLFKV